MFSLPSPKTRGAEPSLLYQRLSRSSNSDCNILRMEKAARNVSSGLFRNGWGPSSGTLFGLKAAWPFRQQPKAITERRIGGIQNQKGTFLPKDSPSGIDSFPLRNLASRRDIPTGGEEGQLAVRGFRGQDHARGHEPSDLARREVGDHAHLTAHEGFRLKVFGNADRI